MNRLLNLFHLMRNRKIGKTFFAIELAKRSKGILICSSRTEAINIAKNHKIKTLIVEDLFGERLLGVRSPVIIDQDAIPLIIEKAIKIEKQNFKLRVKRIIDNMEI